MLFSAVCMLLAFGVVALAVMFCCRTMRLGGIFMGHC
jgi:hypothetical protein